jgi:hypothetical protein
MPMKTAAVRPARTAIRPGMTADQMAKTGLDADVLHDLAQGFYAKVRATLRHDTPIP